MTALRVGGLPVEEDQAQSWVEEYLLPGGAPSGYPAYDAYEGSGKGRRDLGDADLLAPALLNVHRNPVPTYYSLQALVPALNEGLGNVPADVALEDADDGVVDAWRRCSASSTRRRSRSTSGRPPPQHLV
ncbi:DUF6308 family protein [Sinomonas atrocyanea]|jgi:hypothetical protein|uniref:DUF6308 family protein n=1 Tax=Sinomonas atrocyanea TaxID=37927 RepID=UPI00278019DC|nr:DUF6308 family protein [Sinomonas atrocyanea]MDQ0261924.1 hypothetical protein [Sinomonas atrocyanea]MDR6623688.1 hypothetical protein [Sinomonas atrocyanea]